MDDFAVERGDAVRPAVITRPRPLGDAARASLCVGLAAPRRLTPTRFALLRSSPPAPPAVDSAAAVTSRCWHWRATPATASDRSDSSSRTP